VDADADENDRPYIGGKDDARARSAHKAFRCYGAALSSTPGLPYALTIMKHTGWIGTERTLL
jgi:hypothetical protein